MRDNLFNSVDDPTIHELLYPPQAIEQLKLAMSYSHEEFWALINRIHALKQSSDGNSDIANIPPVQ